MIPSVSITKTDGNLGVASDTDRILAIIGPASAGDTNSAFSFTSKSDMVDEFESGMLVTAGAYMLARGIPVVLIRTVATTDGAYGTLEQDGVVGTATVANGSTDPDGNFDVIVEILTGGALGTAGIIFRYSLDNGENYSQPQALGVALTLTCERGVSFTLASAASTLLEGDTWSVTTTAPVASTTDLADALDALADYSGEWLRVLVLTDATTTILGQLDTFVKSFHAEGKNPEAIACTRRRDLVDESRAEYQTAMATIAAAVQSAEVSCSVDLCEMIDEIDGWRLKMPQSIAYAARLMIIDDSQDASAKSDGALPGVYLETPNGVRNYHDERRFPGLDGLGFTTMRTWGGRPVSPGVYINNPRLLAGQGSDYRYFQHSAIVNRIIESTFSLLQPRLSRAVLCDSTTGRIREDVAKGIEEAITAELRTIYSDPGRVSEIRMTLSRTDNVLSTDALHFDVQAVPLAYIKHFIGKAGLVRLLATN